MMHHLLVGRQMLDAASPPRKNRARRFGASDEITCREATLNIVDGVYRFRTILPGRVPGPGDTLQAPHIALSVFGRGIIKRLATRLYFAGAAGNDDDPILACIPEERRATVIAQRRDDGVWCLNLRLAGPHETVFFDL